MSLPLAIEQLQSGDKEPVHWFYVLHGILGRRANWRGFCRRLQALRPDWGFILVDLPEHGESPDLDTPHTVEQCAERLSALSESLDRPLTHGIGHSFGGKVLSAWAQRSPASARACWLIDSNPGDRPHGQGSAQIRSVLEVLPKLAGEFAQRRDFIDACASFGFPTSFSQWLAMNLMRTESGPLRFRPRSAVIEHLVRDYFQYDAWPIVEARPTSTQWHLVIGEASDNYGPDARARARRIAAQSSSVQVHLIPEAGHWVHVDAPEILAKEISASTQP